MGIGSMTPGLFPLIRGGGASGSTRSPDVPTLVTPRLTNAAGFFDDFLATAVGPERYGETPPALYGHPAWQYTTLGTGGGSVGCATTTTAVSLGTMSLAPSSGGGFLVYTPGRTTASGGAFFAGATSKAVGMWRFNFGGTSTSRIDGIGWVRQSFSQTTDWVTDPDVTLATTDAFVLTRHSSTYGTYAAGDWVLRVYSNGGTDNDSTLVVPSASADTSMHKLEVSLDGANTMRWYWDGALVWTKTLGALVNTNYRPSMACIPSGASKVLSADCLYQEVSLTTAR